MTDGIKQFVYYWVIKYPLDYWWRKKHSISFNSPQHREMSIIDIIIEWEMDKLFRREEREKPYIPGEGNYMKEVRMKELSEEDFDNIDFTKIK